MMPTTVQETFSSSLCAFSRIFRRRIAAQLLATKPEPAIVTTLYGGDAEEVEVMLQ